MKPRDIVRFLTPPVFICLARRVTGLWGPRVEWEYVPEGWAYVDEHPEVRGWDVPEVLEAYKKKWPKFVSMVKGVGPLGMAHESSLADTQDITSHNEMISFAYVLALAGRSKERMSMLDWGGGIGHFYLLAQELMPGLDIEYHCKDLPLLCEYGARLFPKQHFFIDERCFDRTYDLILASTSLHYAEDWQALVRDMAGSVSGYLYIANVPSVERAASFVFVQRPYRYGYNTEYLGWCLNRAEFLQEAEGAGLELVREFIYGHAPFINGAPEQNVYRGYLFKAIKKGAL